MTKKSIIEDVLDNAGLPSTNWNTVRELIPAAHEGVRVNHRFKGRKPAGSNGDRKAGDLHAQERTVQSILGTGRFIQKGLGGGYNGPRVYVGRLGARLYAADVERDRGIAEILRQVV